MTRSGPDAPLEENDSVPADRRRSRRRARVWLAALAGSAAAGAILLIAVNIPISSDALRQRLIDTLSDRLQSDVEIAGLELRVLPRFHVEASGLRIRHHGRTDVPPLIKVDRLTVDADLPILLLRRHVAAIGLEGLEINIPPDESGRDDESPGGDQRSADAKTGQGVAREFVIDRLETADARLVIIPRSADKSPKVWQIHQLAMRSVSFARPMSFEATLTNAVPPGEIYTRGRFGPWQSAVPGATALDGTFMFSDADLGVFKGISGILSARGEFGGSLDRIRVHGETDTPRFTVSISGHPVPLHADYDTTVDGTNGDTLLDRVEASFLGTSLVAHGGVVGKRGQDGRTVTLDVAMEKARLEDVLRLAVKAPKPPMTGAMKLWMKFVLPPGDRDVVERLRLDGRFEIETARFASYDVQKKIDELSRPSRAGSSPAADKGVVSNFSGRFKLGDGTLSLPSLTFNTPGTTVRLAGAYELRPEILDFKGMLVMDASISETQHGWKRFLFKIADPIFARKGGTGTALPIKIRGHRTNPTFGIDAAALLRHRK